MVWKAQKSIFLFFSQREFFSWGFWKNEVIFRPSVSIFSVFHLPLYAQLWVQIWHTPRAHGDALLGSRCGVPARTSLWDTSFCSQNPLCWISSRFPDVFVNPFNPFSEQPLSCDLKGIFHPETPKSSLFSLRNFTPAGGCHEYTDLLFSTSSHHPTSAPSG